MLCSAKELGIAEDAAGLLILSPEAKVGAPISEVFPNDTILDVEITPNRADLLSHFGLAREIGALFVGRALRLPSFELATVEATSSAGGAPALQISAPNECPFYSARRIENLTVGPSPAWLRAKLEAVGLRAVNNVVDVTNFVMLELGQPLHAFDADKVSGGINVRLAQPNEKFLALDGRTYQLDAKNAAHRRCRTRRRDRRRDGRRGYRRDRDNAQRDPGKRLLFAGQYPAHGARIESAERCQLPFRARGRSGNDSARLRAGRAIAWRNRRRPSGRRDDHGRECCPRRRPVFLCVTRGANNFSERRFPPRKWIGFWKASDWRNSAAPRRNRAGKFRVTAPIFGARST